MRVWILDILCAFLSLCKHEIFQQISILNWVWFWCGTNRKKFNKFHENCIISCITVGFRIFFPSSSYTIVHLHTHTLFVEAHIVFDEKAFAIIINFYCNQENVRFIVTFCYVTSFILCSTIFSQKKNLSQNSRLSYNYIRLQQRP